MRRWLRARALGVGFVRMGGVNGADGGFPVRRDGVGRGLLGGVGGCRGRRGGGSCRRAVFESIRVGRGVRGARGKGGSGVVG